ncbi:hypothetical protein OHA37_08870 [Streptomyces sp. NBC_00335]|uniref:hypothetical protein n=1 Tax=unclassified Streptomyces TaxID=2593676 RepID=UPI002257C9AC|nr:MULTISPECIES: hypothetical protein [unclassified Streptomyces]MCX5403996.1 hypothetical protein [Streptomyces sp. NBC_00086]
MTTDDWVAEARRLQRAGASIIDIAGFLREFGENGGRKINAASALGKEYGWSVKQKLELLSWTEGGVTDEELISFAPSWLPGE